jgi:biotin carboxyl carrier protein
VQVRDELLVMEAMKMEIGVKALQAGRIEAVYCTAGKPAAAGDLLLALRPAQA